MPTDESNKKPPLEPTEEHNDEAPNPDTLRLLTLNRARMYREQCLFELAQMDIFEPQLLVYIAKGRAEGTYQEFVDKPDDELVADYLRWKGWPVKTFAEAREIYCRRVNDIEMLMLTYASDV